MTCERLVWIAIVLLVVIAFLGLVWWIEIRSARRALERAEGRYVAREGSLPPWGKGGPPVRSPPPPNSDADLDHLTRRFVDDGTASRL